MHREGWGSTEQKGPKFLEVSEETSQKARLSTWVWRISKNLPRREGRVHADFKQKEKHV